MTNSFLEKQIKIFFPKMNILETYSGTAALITILGVLKEKNKNKNEVIIPSVACPAILFAVNFLNLKPVFVDMNLKNFNMNFIDTKKKTSLKTLAVIQVHCFGIVSEIEKVKKYLIKKDIFLIEDACLVFGGKLNSSYLGSYGDASILSFGYDKILSYKGGALLIKSKLMYKKCKVYLTKNKNLNKEKIEKKNFLSKIKKLDNEIKYRKKIAKFINENLINKSFIKPRYNKKDIYWRYPLIFKGNREKLIERAKRKKILITKHYPAMSRYQNNLKLKNADIMDKQIINLFVTRQKNKSYIKKAVNFLNNY
tara:strand:- start:45119 stop:46048 length:930 start_codon:yes stop_codon:yes gene_type:complete